MAPAALEAKHKTHHNILQNCDNAADNSMPNNSRNLTPQIALTLASLLTQTIEPYKPLKQTAYTRTNGILPLPIIFTTTGPTINPSQAVLNSKLTQNKHVDALHYWRQSHALTFKQLLIQAR
ncbi:Cytochrome c oxidase subunit 3 [Candidatus Hodgkinia cicadicola]|nr:Cytochrome c oxidase subunit 3 [Candidatus Hodgkinia cicadicola]